MRTALFLAGCLASAPLCAWEQAGPVLTFTEPEMAACAAGGGCLVITRQALLEVQERAGKEALLVCRNRT